MVYIHPNRTSKNVQGDFYTIGYWHDSEESGECLDCLLPENIAPKLLADIEKEDTYTHFIRQPVTRYEIEQACDACESCCVNALRYGGQDLKIINRFDNNPEHCDYIVRDGELVLSLDSKGNYLPYSEKVVTSLYLKRRIKRYFSLWHWKLVFKSAANKLLQLIKKSFDFLNL